MTTLFDFETFYDRVLRLDPQIKLPTLVCPRPEWGITCLEALLPAVAELTLSEVDGEFYWRCCRYDVFIPFDYLWKALSGIRLCTDGSSVAAKFRGLREAVVVGDGITWAIEYIAERCPPPILERLLLGQRIALDTPYSYLVPAEGDEPPYRFLHVSSAAWTGAQVEAALRVRPVAGRPSEFLAARAAQLAQRQKHAEPDPVDDGQTADGGEERSVHITNDLYVRYVTYGKPERVRNKTPREYPYIEVGIQEPLPPPGWIAFQYDQIVRETNGWHRTFPGSTQQQEIHVALRTWATGWLVGCGYKVADALRTVCEVMQIEEPSPQRFDQDRQKLLERVPEARRYLYQRDPRAREMEDWWDEMLVD